MSGLRRRGRSGASWGGLHALERACSAGSPADFARAVVVAQHRDADADETCCRALLARRQPAAGRRGRGQGRRSSPAPSPGAARLPPARRATGTSSCRSRSPCSSPAVDRRAVRVGGRRVRRARRSACVLTGANADGARGPRRDPRRGGYTIVQDPDDRRAAGDAARRARARRRPTQVARRSTRSPALLSLACAEERR